MTDSCVGDVNLVGCSEAIGRVREFARRIACGDAKVLLTGESGVGKDLVARYVHLNSSRATRAFVPVNCAGLSDSLLEGELFGHLKGSFTGAYRDKVGRLQLAHRGTIFLDEVGEMSLRMQALLLRFLENGEIQPVGSERVAAAIDVRVIAATNRNLPGLVAEGTFREDLLYRIKVVHIEVPPLRERSTDVRALVASIIARTGRNIRFSEEALRLMESYAWPGNVRELQNVVEQVSWVADDVEIGPEHLPHAIAAAVSGRNRVVERRRQVADHLYEALSSGKESFWGDVHQRFLQRDLTRHDLRELIRRGLANANGNYRAMLPLLGLPMTDYKRFLNFLASHDCVVDYRGFRAEAGRSASARR
jgi:transcriptional regulator with GAF, ATPase, and Fis domain